MDHPGYDQKKKPKKSPWYFLFAGCVCCGALELLGGLCAAVLGWILKLQPEGHVSQAASVGIIGGADGPTAIFVATAGWTSFLFPVVILAAGIAGLLWLKYKRI